MSGSGAGSTSGRESHRESDRASAQEHERASSGGSGRESVGEEPVDVRARPRGPWVVRAGVPVVRVDPVPAAHAPVPGPDRVREVPVDVRRGDVALCRCGATASRPVCDRSHRNEGDGADPFACPAPRGVEAGHVLAAAPLCPAGGVLVVAGDIVVAAGVRVRFVDASLARLDGPALLCRCGAHMMPLADTSASRA